MYSLTVNLDLFRLRIDDFGVKSFDWRFRIWDCGLKSFDFGLSIWDCGWRVKSNEFRLWIAHCRLLTADCRLQNYEYWMTSFDWGLLTADSRLPIYNSWVKEPAGLVFFSITKDISFADGWGQICSGCLSTSGSSHLYFNDNLLITCSHLNERKR